ncbi:hypothetical protein AAMO2058_000297200 [Amorphochlora amoebiformis]|uniref:FHA domain-containing protein n=1 Tax=Amorphochlora amoebiformis TaxID=1561963 RepID=A0A7S0CSN3_9EUKA
MAGVVPSGRIAFIDEILESKDDGGSFRVTGRLEKYDAEREIATIVSKESKRSLKVKTDLLSDFRFDIGSLFQFIGEYHTKRGFIRARIGRNVNGMDMELYATAVKLCREHCRLPM